MRLKILFSIMIASLVLNLHAQEQEAGESKSDTKFKFRANAELGFLAVLSHNIQFGNEGTYYDYVKEGGQDVLFPFSRLSIEMDIGHHTIVFLYQPLRIESEALLSNPLVVDGLTFPAETGIRNLYNFPFYRISYMKELTKGNSKWNFALGATVQIRNATISFESLDGSLFRSDRNIGIVPALKFRTGTSIGNNFFTEIEADGIYAPVSYLNGSDDEIVGAILDASYRIGTKLQSSDLLYLNLRYLGGGAVGTDNDDTGPGDGYVRNWLNFLTVSVGYTHEF